MKFTLLFFVLCALSCADHNTYVLDDKEYIVFNSDANIKKIVFEQNDLKPDSNVSIVKLLDNATNMDFRFYVHSIILDETRETYNSRNHRSSFQYKIYDDTILYILHSDKSLILNKVATYIPEPGPLETNIESIEITLKDTSIVVGFDTDELYNDYELTLWNNPEQ